MEAGSLDDEVFGSIFFVQTWERRNQANSWGPSLRRPPQTRAQAPVPDAEETIRALHRLPPFSPVAIRLMQLVSQEDVGLRQVSDVVSADAVLAGGMLRLANSPLFGARHTVTGVLHAVAMLGIDRVRALVTTVALRQYIDTARGSPAFTRCWRHNLACALVTEEIAAGTAIDRDFAYTAGLMHDIGRLAMLGAWPERYANVLAAPPADGGVLARERQEFGIDHCRAGTVLVEKWQLPREFYGVAGKHHDQPGEGQTDIRSLVHFGCELADALGFEVTGQAATAEPSAQVDSIPTNLRDSLEGDLADLGMRVADRINSLECDLMY